MSLHDHPLLNAIRNTWPGASTTITGGHALTDPSTIERAAMQTAADRAGDFIESLGRTDMARWSAEEWDQFIAVVCSGYVDALVEKEAEAARAVSKVRVMP